MDNTELGMIINFTRSEKTVLVDALNWYIEYTKDSIFVEELTDDEIKQINKIINDLNKDHKCELNSEYGSLIINEVIPEFAQRLKTQIGLPEVENKKKTGGFYRTQFENISEKIKDANKEQNPFF